MNVFKTVVNKMLRIKGGVYGILSVSIQMILVLISYSLIPDFNIMIHYISLLGIAPGIASWCFNLGLIMAGMLLIPFYIYIGRILKREYEEDYKNKESNERIRKHAVQFAVTGAVALSLVGCFPMYNEVFEVFHTVFAGIVFTLGIVYSICFGLLILRDERIHNFHGYFFFTASASVMLFFLTQSAWAEWLTLFVQAALVIDFSVYTLYKKF